MSFSHRSLLRSLLSFGSFGSSKGRKLNRTIHGRRLHLEPLEDRSLLSVGVSGVVWHDANLDGLQSAEELGAAGAVAEVFSSTDDVVGNLDDVSLGVAITDADGVYSFADLPEATNYYVVFRTPVGYEFTEQDIGADNTIDSDADAEGITDLFTIPADTTASHVDAGLIGDSPEFGWALNGGVIDERASAEAVAIDDDGNTYVTGYFAGTLDFDHGPGEFNLASAGNYDVFVAKYSADGALVWAKSFGGESADKGYDLDRDNDGSLYVTGYFYDTVDFDPGEGVYELTSAGDNDAFTIKLDADGNLVWATAIGGEHADLTRSIAIAADGSILTTGYTTHEDQGLAIEPNTDIVIHKQGADGNLIWTKTIGGDDSDEGAGITVADDGSVFVTGYFSGTTDFDPGEDVYSITVGDNYYGYGDDDPDNYDNIQDSFVLKLDADANFVWATGLDGNEIDVLNDIAIAPDGNVYATGSTSQQATYVINPFPFPIQFFPTTVIGGPNGGCINGGGFYGSISSDYPFLPDLYITPLSSEFSTSGSDSFDADGEQGLILAALNETLYTNSISLSELGSLLVKLDADGNLLWSESYGSARSEGSGVTVGADGNIYVAGNLLDETNFNSDTDGFVLDGGDGSALVSVWNPEGEFVKAYLAESSDIATGHDIAVSAAGDVYIVGTFNDTTDFDPTGGVYNLTNLGDADFFVCKFLALEAPVAIVLSSQSVAEDLDVGATVGDFDTDGNQTGVTFVYALVEGQGDDNNASFLIEGNQLQTNKVFDYSAKDSYTIRVRATDNFGQTTEEVFLITILDRTAPKITLDAPSYSNDTTPSVTVTSNEDGTVYLDVDLNNDGDYDDDGEAGYTSTTLVDGSVTFDITPELAEGSYNLQARVFDAAGNEDSDRDYVHIVTTPPNVDLTVPEHTNSLTQTLTVSLDDIPLIYQSVFFVMIDVDLNSDGDFDDVGEVTDQANFVKYCNPGDEIVSLITNLVEGTYNLRARVTDGANNEGVSDVMTMTVDMTPPEIDLDGPAHVVYGNAPAVIATSTEGETVYLDVDLNNDGDYNDDGETSYTTATLVDGSATFDITPELTEGTYSLRARVTDAAGNEGVSNIVTMTVDPIAPMISKVVISDVGAGKNGTLESTDKLVITWNEAGEAEIASRSLKIDGQAVNKIGGPSAEGNCYGLFGPLSAGDHEYTITITDNNGEQFSKTGTFNIAAIQASVPVVSKVALGENAAGSNHNGELESTDNLVITWNEAGGAGIASRSLDIDGQAVTSIGGPSAEGNCFGLFGPLAAGEHEYTIAITDQNGVQADKTGTFTVAAVQAFGPVVSKVALGENTAGSNHNGELESTDKLVITWNESSEAGIASRSLVIDGQTITKVGGPSVEGNCFGLFGPLAAGEHAYTITIADSNGKEAVKTGTFNVAAVPASAPVVSRVAIGNTAGTHLNGELESTDKLVITWNESSEAGIASRSLKIDGQAVTNIGGPDANGNCFALFGPLAEGEHGYTITITDNNSVVATKTGTFAVTDAVVVQPSISNIVTVEAKTGSDLDGVFEPTDKLLITWRENHVGDGATRSLKVDGQIVSTIGGPNADNCCFGIVGPLSAGTHSYSIEATTSGGEKAEANGTIVVVAALASSTPGGTTGTINIGGTTGGLVLGGGNVTLDTGGTINGGSTVDSVLTSLSGTTSSGGTGTLTLASGNTYYSQPTPISVGTAISGGTLTLAGAKSHTLALDVDASLSDSAATLAQTELTAIAAEAARRWETALGEEATAALDNVNTSIVNLSGNTLAGLHGSTIYVDYNAAGYGWFVDPTPAMDEEFADDDYGSLVALDGGEAADRADLLSAVMHEMGHVLGYGQAADDLMDSLLPLGRRETV